SGHRCHAGEIAARTVQAGDEIELNGIRSDQEDDGYSGGCRLCRHNGRKAIGVNHAHLATDQVRGQCGQAIVLTVRPMIFDRNVAALDKPSLAQALVKGRRCIGAGPPDRKNSDHRHRVLLRARGERRARRGAANERNEFAAPHHWINSSARRTSVAGISRPIALAVLRLITSSNLVGNCTGRSLILAPRRMRSTYEAATDRSRLSGPYPLMPPSAV